MLQSLILFLWDIDEWAILIQEFAVRLILVFMVGVSRHTKFSLSKARFSLIYFDNMLYWIAITQYTYFGIYQPGFKSGPNNKKKKTSEFQKFLIPQVFVVNTFTQRLLLLLRMFKVISLGANFEFSCIWAFWPRPFLMFYAMINFYMIDILGQEGCRDLIFSLKWPQCPHLY